MINVGASGEDGELVMSGENGGSDNDFSSSFGDGMDLTAPGINDLVQTTSKLADDDYSSFNGTSAALPYVTGTAAMLMLHHPMPLAQEDVEHLLEYTTDTENPGYDPENGWGKLNAGSALKFIDPSGDNYRVIQVELSGDYTFDDDPFDCGDGCGIILPEGERELAEGEAYFGTVRKYSQSFSIDISSLGSGLTAPDNFLNDDPTKPTYWTRSANTNLWFTPEVFGAGTFDFKADNHLFFEPDTQIDGNIFSGTISGYAIILESDDNDDSFPVFCTNGKFLVSPTSPVNINECYFGAPKMTFSFLAKDPVTEVPPQVIDIITDAVTINRPKNYLRAFPNPTQDIISIQLLSSQSEEGMLKLYDAQGQFLTGQNISTRANVSWASHFDLRSYPAGIYCLQFTQGKSTIVQKIVKQ